MLGRRRQQRRRRLSGAALCSGIPMPRSRPPPPGTAPTLQGSSGDRGRTKPPGSWRTASGERVRWAGTAPPPLRGIGGFGHTCDGLDRHPRQRASATTRPALDRPRSTVVLHRRSQCRSDCVDALMLARCRSCRRPPPVRSRRRQLATDQVRCLESRATRAATWAIALLSPLAGHPNPTSPAIRAISPLTSATPSAVDGEHR
jgi:hypothetical protein